MVIKKQSKVTLSITEAEFIATTSCAFQAIWLRRLIRELGYDEEEPTLLFCDNVSTFKLSNNYSKHIDVRFHFFSDLCKDGVIDVIHWKSQLARLEK